MRPLSKSTRTAPELVAPYRNLIMAMLEQAQDKLGSTPDWNLRRLKLTANYTDDNRPATALPILDELVKDVPPDDSLIVYVHRVWGMTALAASTRRIESAAALEADLSGPARIADRATVVTLLADLYASLHSPIDESKLLARELKQPEIAGDADATRRLSARYDALRGGPPVAKTPARAAQGAQNSVSMPKPVKQVRPEYPAALQKQGTEGTVLVDFIVSASGSVENARTISSPDDELSKLAEAAVAQWQFEPAQKDGVAVRYRMRVPVPFTAPKKK